MAHKELVLLLLLGLAARGLSLSCSFCPFDCGAPPSGCVYGIVGDVCGCCDECARGPGEECGGPFQIGRCGDGLECAPAPDQYRPGVCVDKWTSETNACISGNNNLVLDRIFSLDDCKARCQAQSQTVFSCRSVEYHSRSRRCVLSDATSRSFDYTEPCLNRGWTFTEIIDVSVPPFCTVEGNTCASGVCRSECDYANGEYTSPFQTCGGHNCVCCAFDPPSDEFTIGSQTFVVLQDRKGVTWNEASDACFDLGYELAEPNNARSLAEYLLRNYGLTYYWLGGRGTGFSVEWLSGETIPRRSSLWRTDYQTSSNYCVYLRDDGSPNPLGMYSCEDRRYLVPLCEVRAPPPAAPAAPAVVLFE